MNVEKELWKNELAELTTSRKIVLVIDVLRRNIKGTATAQEVENATLTLETITLGDIKD